MIFPGGEREGIHASVIFYAEIGVVSEQEFDDFRVASPCSRHQCRATVLALRIDVGSAVKQQLHDINLVAESRNHQRRLPVSSRDLGVHTGVQKEFNGFGVSFSGRLDELSFVVFNPLACQFLLRLLAPAAS